MQPLPARLVPVVLSLGALLVVTSCRHVESDSGSGSAGDGGGEQPRMCTEIGCGDAATITTQLSAAGAPLGTHSFTLEVDGAAQTCNVDFKTETETAYAECSGGASLLFGPAMQGKEQSMDGAVGYTEEPIPGEFRWQLTLPGQPAKVHVVHSHGANTILDQTATLTYTDHRPNGPDCEPVCKSASVEWKGP